MLVMDAHPVPAPPLMGKRASVFFLGLARIKAGPNPIENENMISVPIYHFAMDVLILSSELLTGKSIPVLVGIARLPIDQFLAGVVLSLGAAAGAVFSFYASRAVSVMHPLSLANRLVQLLFSLCLSLSLLLSLARGIHYERGVILSIVPAFVVASQTLVQRDSTVCVLFLASVSVYWYCMVTPVVVTVDNSFPAQQQQLPSVLQSLNTDSPQEEVAGVWDVLLRALQLFVLAFYAGVQHAPTQDLCTSQHGDAVYASPYYAKHASYALYVNLFSALLRVCVWYGVCFFQSNVLHVMLENDLSRGGWDWSCCVLYSTLLLYAACWTATQLREQVLPFFKLTSVTDRLKLLVCALSLAALYRQRAPEIVFFVTTGLSLACLAAAAGALRPSGGGS